MADPRVFLTATQAEALLADLPSGATALLLGGTDTGKTTFALAAVAAQARRGRTAALLDCDPGQSEIGPPATVGVGLTPSEPVAAIRSGRDLTLLETAFIGATSPVGHELALLAGACRVAHTARLHRPDLLLIDTPGWIQGGAAQLARRLADLLQPQLVLAFARGDELASLLVPFRGLQMPQVHLVTPAPEASRKTPSARAARRTLRFGAALDGATEHVLSVAQTPLCGTGLFTGEPLPHHVQQFLSRSLAAPVLHAERQPNAPPYIVINGERWDTLGLAPISEYFRTKAATIVPAQRFARLLVGLQDPHGSLLDIGLISRIDFTQRTVTVLTACHRPAAIAQIWCGTVRLRPDGREIATLRPREI